MMVMCACNFSNDVMARGVAECRNQHRFCIQCALNTAPKSFGIRDLVLRSSVDQALTWFGFKCSVCGVKGPLRRSLATDTAVAALPVRCGSSEDGATCRWTGRRDEFDAHRHVFSDEELELQATEQQSPSRGTKRPNEDRDSNEVDDPHDVKQCRRYQQTSEQSENEAGFLGGQITSPGTVPGSAAPGIDAAGDPEVLDVTSVEIHQEDDELYITVEESQSGQSFSASSSHDAGNPTNIRQRPNEDRDSNKDEDRRRLLYQQTFDNDDEGQSEDDVGFQGEQINSPGTVPGSAIPDTDAAGEPEDLDVISVEIHEEEDELYVTVEDSQSGQSSSASSGDELEDPTDARDATNARDAVHEKLQELRRALQDSGHLPEPTVAPVDRAANFIYDVVSGAFRSVTNILKR